MAALKILLPYNFTAHDRKALAFAVQVFGPLPEAELTLYHAYPPIAEVAGGGDPSAAAQLKRRLAYLTEELTDREIALKEVQQETATQGFGRGRVHYLFKSRKQEVAAAIVETAREGGFGVVVLNHKPGGISHFFTGSSYAKVVAGLTETTVCIVS